MTEKIAAFIAEYNEALDTAEVAPNGDDFNALCDGIRQIISGKSCPIVQIAAQGR